MKRFLIACSGAEAEILAQCPTEETKYAGIGTTILFTAVLAGLSGGYAIFTVFHSVTAALPFAVLWALMIFNLDRVIISGMRKQLSFRRDLLYASPRLVVAMLLAIVISKPIELKLFEKEIEAQITRTRNEQYQQSVKTLDTAYPEIDRLARDTKRLESEIETKQAQVDRLHQELTEEEDGTGGSHHRDIGPIARDKERRLQRAAEQLKTLEETDRARIARNDQQRKYLEDDRQRRLRQEDQVQAAADGFLARLQALSRLAADNAAVRVASSFVALMFIALEISPVALKLLSTLSPFRPYEQLLEDREWQAAEASQQFRILMKRKLKQVTQKEMAEIDDLGKIEMTISSERNRQRLDAELRANEALMLRIAAAQTEIAERIVEKWKAQEMDKVDHDPAPYIQ